jgi:hypothetical protein
MSWKENSAHMSQPWDEGARGKSQFSSLA